MNQYARKNRSEHSLDLGGSRLLDGAAITTASAATARGSAGDGLHRLGLDAGSPARPRRRARTRSAFRLGRGDARVVELILVQPRRSSRRACRASGVQARPGGEPCADLWGGRGGARHRAWLVQAGRGRREREGARLRVSAGEVATRYLSMRKSI